MSEVSLQELKAQAYDCMAQVQHFQRMFEQINNQIAVESNKPQNKPEEEPKK